MTYTDATSVQWCVGESPARLDTPPLRPDFVREVTEHIRLTCDEATPVLRGSINLEDGEIKGRWGFGPHSQVTSAFVFRRCIVAEESSGGCASEEENEGDGPSRTESFETSPPREVVAEWSRSVEDDKRCRDGNYEGYFEMLQFAPASKQHPGGGGENDIDGSWHTKRVYETLTFHFLETLSGLEIEASGMNEYGPFCMVGQCEADGTRLQLVRRYKPPVVAKESSRSCGSVVASMSTPEQHAPDHDAPSRPSKLLDSLGPARITRASRTAVSRDDDAGAPLARLFEQARETVSDVPRARRVRTVDIAEAAALVSELIEPRPVKAGGAQRRRFSFTDENLLRRACSATERSTTLVSELDYERYVRIFVDAFEKGGFGRLWAIASQLLDESIEATPAEPEPQIVRLVLSKEDDARRSTRSVASSREKSAPAVLPPAAHSAALSRAMSSTEMAIALRGEVEPTNPGSFHVNTISNGFGIRAFDGLDALVLGGADLTRRGARAVVLDARISAGSDAERYCNDLADLAGMARICPADRGWRFGPTGSTLAGGEDRRHYLIIGWEGGLTPTHCDFGVQAVLYNTLAGCNRVLGVPREVAVVLHALRESLVNNGLGWSKECDAKLIDLEAQALDKLMSMGKVEYDEFVAGESMLILPRGGHAVLTGQPDKVVLAGEWHLQPDGKAALALPNAFYQRQTKKAARRASTTTESSPCSFIDDENHQNNSKRLRPVITKGLGRQEPDAPTCRERALTMLSLSSEQDLPHAASPLREAEQPLLVEKRGVNADDDALVILNVQDVAAAVSRRAPPARIEMKDESPCAILVAKQAFGLADTSIACELNVHVRPSWDDNDPIRWLDLSIWARIALEADAAAARAAGASSLILGCLITTRALTKGDVLGPKNVISLDEELLARLVEAVKPTRLALCAPSFDALVLAEPPLAARPPIRDFQQRSEFLRLRAHQILGRLSRLGIAASYTRAFAPHPEFFTELQHFARSRHLRFYKCPSMPR